jgi:GEVED domain/Secretion system C-terminal sorting domain
MNKKFYLFLFSFLMTHVFVAQVQYPFNLCNVSVGTPTSAACNIEYIISSLGIEYYPSASFEQEELFLFMPAQTGNTFFCEMVYGGFDLGYVSCYVDWNGNNTFESGDEDLGTTSVYEGDYSYFEYYVPSDLEPGIRAGRVVISTSSSDDGPCGSIAEGGVIDFIVDVTNGHLSSCWTTSLFGGLDGDYIASCTGNTMSYTGSSLAPSNMLLADQFENVTIGSTCTFNITSGTYAGDNYALYVCAQNQYIDGSQLKDTHTTSSAGENFTLSFNVPANAQTGVYKARIVCAYSTNNNPFSASNDCHELGYGHAIDFFIYYNEDVDASPYCDPEIASGSNLGNFISSFALTQSPVSSSQSSPDSYYTYFSSDEGNEPLYALSGYAMSGSIAGGTATGNNQYRGWIDANSSNSFESNELFFSASTNNPLQSTNFNGTTPNIAGNGFGRLRIANQGSSNANDPCQIGNVGEVEDYDVILVKGNDTYCSPYFGLGNSNGYFINGVNVSTLDINNVGFSGISFYRDFTNYVGQVIPGETFQIALQAGEATNASYQVWVDWNNNGDYETSEKVGLPNTNTVSYQTFFIDLTVPNNAPLGQFRRMRIVCKDDLNLQPCIAGMDNGEYLEAKLKIVNIINVDEEVNDKFSVYPNPSTEEFVIDGGYAQKAYHFTVVDHAGRVIDRQQFSGRFVYQHNLSAGSYFVTVESENTKQVFPLIVQ